jgi:hypothetical protein
MVPRQITAADGPALNDPVSPSDRLLRWVDRFLSR